MTGLVARAEIDLAVGPDRVWDALTDPDQIEKYMFGSRVSTDWVPGHSIEWSGEYEGRPYTDKGEVVEVQAPRRLVVTHYSPMSGQPDEPGSYHTLTYELAAEGSGTRLTLSQDNNGSADEQSHSTENWEAVLGSLKKVVESTR